MSQTIKEPQQRISDNAVKMWRMNSIIEIIVEFAILGILLYLHYHYDWVEWIGHVLYLLIILCIINSIYEIFIQPIYQQRTWRYEVDAQYIQVKRGAIKKTYLIIPMTKVQYVNTNQGPLLRKYGLATIKIGTMASTHEIPAIPEEDAVELRNHIALLAQISESEG